MALQSPTIEGSPQFCDPIKGDKVRDLILKAAILAAVYFVAGYLSLLIGIRPDFSIVLWAPAGFALAGLLLCGNRIWPGVFIGAFCITLFVSVEPVAVFLSGTAVLFAGIHATGSTLQALVGAVCVRRFVSFPTALEKTSDTLWLIFLGGPVACLINSINGAVALHLIGLAAEDQLLTNWFTWWFGDAVGVVAFTPILILLFSRDGSVTRSRKLVVTSGLVCLFVLAGVAFFAAKLQSHEQKRLEFQAQSNQIADQFRRDSELHISVLASTGQFLRAPGDVSFALFSTFTEEFFTRYPGIHALSWNPKIAHARRHDFENRLRAQGYPDFQIKDLMPGRRLVVAPPHPVYFPVTYIVPYEANSVVHGHNTYAVNEASGDQRRRALDKARDTGDTVTTSRISVVQASDQHALLVYHPVFNNALQVGDLAWRRQHLAGYTVGVFLIPNMLAATQKVADQLNIHFTLHDSGASVEKQFLYDSRTPDHKKAIPVATVETYGLRSFGNIEFAGRTFQMSFVPSAGYLASTQNWYLWAVLVGALLFTGLVGVILLIVTAQTAVVGRAVTEKTAELRLAEQQLRKHSDELSQTNEQLESFSYMASHDLQEPVRKLVSFSEFLEKDLGTDIPTRAKDDLDQIVDAAKRMQTLTLDLLALSRAGQDDIDLRPIAVTQCVDDVLHTLAIRIEEAGARIDRDDLPEVMADSTLMFQLYQNLLSNALKFRAPDRELVIRLTAERQGGHLVLGVQDNGIGIEPVYFEQIFAPFKRLHSRSSYNGTGIGLAICRRAVERHGGRIWVEPVTDGGAHFRFTLDPVGL
ncbi:MAG: hypothetical protein HOK82_21160 [Rhodospirillaceae bacterium]|nr:hypothetical protein [Rhodospirillaceae bacterium]